MRFIYLFYFACVHVLLTFAELMARWMANNEEEEISFTGIGVFRAFVERAGFSNVCEDYENNLGHITNNPGATAPIECQERFESGLGFVDRFEQLLQVNISQTFETLTGILAGVRDFFIISGYPTVMGEGTALELYFGGLIRMVGFLLLIVCFWPLIRGLLTGALGRFGL